MGWKCTEFSVKKNTCLLKWQKYSVNYDRNMVQLKKCMFLRRNRKMSIKIGLLGFGTVASGSFPLEGKW